MSLILDGTNGLSDVDGSAATPAIRGSDANTGVFFGTDIVGVSTGGTERVRVDASGRLLVGTTSDISGGAVQALINGTGTSFLTNAAVYSALSTVAGREIPMVYASDTTNSALISQLSGNMAFFTQGTERARIGASGGFTVSSGDMFASSAGGLVGALGTYNTGTASAANVHILSNGFMLRSTSSLKYKRDVQDAPHGLVEVMALRPVTYKGKNPMDGESVFGGLIAEEVHEAGLTEFVQYADDGTPDALAYGNMVSLCIKAIQEQQAIITALTARVEALEGAQA
jgi:hypothetical protein